MHLIFHVMPLCSSMFYAGAHADVITDVKYFVFLLCEYSRCHYGYGVFYLLLCSHLYIYNFIEWCLMKFRV